MASVSTTMGSLSYENETTLYPMYDSPSPPLFGKIILSVICVFGLAGNVLIICQFGRCRALRTAPNMFIINLAVSDLCFMLCLTPVINNMVAHGGEQGYGPKGCFFHAFTTITSATSSLVSMGLIAIARYVSIVIPKKKSLFTWKVCITLCVGCWAYAILIMVPALMGWRRLGWVPKSYHCTYDWAYNMIYNALVFIFAFGLISLIMCFCYYKIYKVFRDSQRRVAGEGGKGSGINKDELRLAIQLLAVFVIYNICWSPYFAMSLFIDPLGEGPEWLYCILLILVFWNSAVNVLVYLYYNRVFRAECLRLLGLEVTNASNSTTDASANTSN